MSGLPSISGLFKRIMTGVRSCNEDPPPYLKLDPHGRAQDYEKASRDPIHRGQKEAPQRPGTAARQISRSSRLEQTKTSKCAGLCRMCCTKSAVCHEASGQHTNMYEEATKKKRFEDRCHAHMRRLGTWLTIELTDPRLLFAP